MSYSLETRVGDLLDNDATRAILERHLPGISSHHAIGMARKMSLPTVARYAGGLITEDAMQRIDQDLRALG